MRRIIAVLAVFGLLLAGCSSKEPRPDEEVAESTAPSIALPLEVPEGTFMLLRMDLAEMDDAMGHYAEMLNVVEEFSFTSEHPSKRLLAAMLSRPFMRSQSLAPGEVPAEAFRGLDTSGTVWAAVSTAGNEPLLRALENGVPDYGTGMIPRGVFVRMRLPADEPEALAEWLQDACGDTLYCKSRQALEAREDAVVVDYRVGDIPELFEQAEKSAELPAPEPDSLLADRNTPAFRTFAQSKAAMGMYVVSERLVDVGALVGMTQAMRAMESAVPRMRDELYARGMSIAGDLYLMQSPGAREVADSAVFLRVSDTFGFTVDVVQSLTEVGRRVSEAAATEASVSNVMTDRSIVSADVSYNVAAAMDAAVMPGWLDPSEPDTTEKFANMMRTGGVWTYLVAYHNYPMGFSKSLNEFAANAGMQAGALGLIEQFRGLRVAFDMKRDEDGPAQLAPVGGLAAVFETDKDVSRHASRLKAMVDRQAPFSITTETVEIEGGREVRVWAGEDVEFGDAAPVDGMMHASIDLAAMSEFIPGSKGRRSRAGVMSPKVLEKLSHVQLASRRGDNATHARLTIAGSDVSPLEVPDGAAAVGQSEGTSACLKEAREASRGAFSTLDRIPAEKRTEALKRVVSSLERIQSACDEAGEVVRWMRAQWLVRLGVQMAERFRWEEAEAAFSKSCDLKNAKECRWMERLKQARDAIPLASVPKAESFAPSAGIWLQLTETSLRTDAFASVLGLTSSQRVDLDEASWSDDGTLAQAEDLLRLAEARGTFYLAVSREADASVLARLVGMTVSKKLERRRQLLGQTGGGPPEVVVPVRVDDGELGALAFVPASKMGAPAVRIELEKGTDVDLEPLLEQVRALGDGAHVAIVVEQGVAFDEVATVASRVMQAFEGEDGDMSLSLDTR